MRLLVFPSLICLAFLPLSAHASSFAGSSAGTSAGGTSATSGSTSGDDERAARAARGDAARFVATDGAVRGAMLESALRQWREHHPEWVGRSDLQLAQAILTL
jgi:uncharacterized protein (TIGR02448 family)